MDVDVSFTRLEVIAFGAFAFNPALSSVTMAPSLRKVDREAFSNCPSLTQVTVPLETELGDEAFPSHTAVHRATADEVREAALVWL